MQDAVREKIERVLEEKVRPSLGGHQGDIAIEDFTDGVLRVRFLGQCANCPSALYTLESLVDGEVKGGVPEVKRVVLASGVSDETWDMAQRIRAMRRAEQSGHEDRR